MTSSPSRSRENVRPFHARRPDDELGRNEFAARQFDSIRAHSGDPRVRAHLDAQLVQQRERRDRDAFRQSGQNRGRALDQNDADVLVGIDLVEAIGDHLAGGLVEFGGELGAGRARADDRDMQLPGVDRIASAIGRARKR